MKFRFWLNKGDKKVQHLHDWKLQYQTGNASDGKSDVVKCDCGQMAVYHRNPACGELYKYHLLEK
jgi:hypothetical protein